jgi:spore coat polysaccharide biosynthesis protein SpsF
MVAGLWFKEMRTIIIVQARMGSTRLPGKVLKRVMGRPLLEYQIERLKKVENVTDVVIATTISQNDDPIKELCKELHCSYFRGSESDVLLRYYETAIKFNAECIVRVNSDCPLIDPGVVEEIVEYYSNHNELDYVSNILEKSYPIGLHTEVFSMKALRQANDNANSAIEREHVTPYIYRNPDIFKLFSYSIEDDLSKYRWTVDYPEDFELIRIIIMGLYPDKADFNMFDIINLMSSDPGLIKINSRFAKEQTL